jgi:hypothetical protein
MVINQQGCTLQDAINRIFECVNANGGQYRDWYVGVTANPQQRVYIDHNVDHLDPAHVVCFCVNEQTARDVEQAYLKAGCDGGGGGGGGGVNPYYVYAYKKCWRTRP